MARVARGSSQQRQSPVVYAAAILAAGLALSRYGLGNLWHPPANSPFGVPSQSAFSRAVTAREPGADVLVYRSIDGTGVGVAAEHGIYSIFEARYAANHKFDFTGQSEQNPGGAALSVTQVWSQPPVLVAYVNDSNLVNEAAAAVVRWSTHVTTRIVLADRPRAWIVPPPTTSPGAAPQWQRIVVFDRYARPIAIVNPTATILLPAQTPLAPGAFTMPRTTDF